MEVCIDFLNWLDPDISVQILMYLEDPSDLVHVSSVSRSWRDFVIANGLFKHLCLRMFPQLSRVACVMELNKCRAKKPVEVGSSYSMEWESLARDHRVYATLAQVCTSFIVEDCISEAISASSTDHYPDESIHNTLLPAYTWRASYWSSKGQSNPAVPETLIYKLKSEFCVITEINICPFQELLSSLHIYSSNSVRFRMGHPKGPNDLGSCHLGDSLPCNADDTFIWTYTSPEFPMAQEGCLQNFRLPEPVLCIGGILQIELLGRVQRHEMDGLFYICMSYVQVVGRSLSPTFCVEILEQSGTFVLKNDMQGKFYTPPSLPKNEAHEISDDQLQRGFRYWQHFVNILEGNEYAVEFIDEYESGEEEDEAEDDDDDDISGDEDMSFGSAEDDDEPEETPKNVESSKKRPSESATKTPVPAKKAKAATPQKTDGKKVGGHTATPHPSKKGAKTPATSEQSKQKSPKSGGSFSCQTCSKTFGPEVGLQSHTMAKHAGD